MESFYSGNNTLPHKFGIGPFKDLNTSVMRRRRIGSAVLTIGNPHNTLKMSCGQPAVLCNK